MISAGFVVILPLICASISAARIHLPEVQGAEEAIPHSHPWLVLLRMPLMRVKCGAALIQACEGCNRSDIVVTAAHCITRIDTETGMPSNKLVVKMKGIFLTAGQHRLRYDHDWAFFRNVAEVVLHPEWAVDNKSMGNDIAILRTYKPYVFDDKVQPISLPEPNESAPVGTRCKMAGWGKRTSDAVIPSEVLMEINTTIVAHEACSKNEGEEYDEQETVCTASELKGGSTACTGDSGGPLVCADKTGRPTMYGLNSRGPENCEGNVLPLYTGVAAHSKWIRETVEKITTVNTKDEYKCLTPPYCP